MLRIEGPECVHWDLSRTLKIQYHGIASGPGSLLTAVRLDSGTVLYGEPVFDDISHTIDVRSTLSIPWKNGSLLLTLFHGKQCSNRLVVKLALSELAFRDLEVEKFIVSHRRHGRPLPVWPEPGEGIHYRRTPESPEVPAQPGIALKLRKTVLHGSFRLNVHEADIVPAAERKTNRFAFLPVTAIVPITLVVTGDAAPACIPIQLHVPSYSEIDRTAKERTANGFFSIDLQRWADLLSHSRPFIFALSGDAIAGPAG